MEIIDEIKLDFNNVLIQPKKTYLTTRNDVNLYKYINFKNSNRLWYGIPLIAANMDTIGTFEIYDILSKYDIITALHKYYSLDELINNYNERVMNPDLFMISIGIEKDIINKLSNIFTNINCNWICIDIANGYINDLIEYCTLIRANFPSKNIVVGNIATPEIIEELVNIGKVDVIKIGIGPGSACTTRLKTGVGYPQLSAVIECAKKAHELGVQIISDGGITCPGDLGKAFGGGADFIMMGGVLSGHDENPGDIEIINNKEYKTFYGMSSSHSMEKNYKEQFNYRTSEGRYLKVEYKGPLENTINDYLGGLRSTCTYINAKRIDEIYKNCTFIRVNQQLNTSLLK